MASLEQRGQGIARPVRSNTQDPEVHLGMDTGGVLYFQHLTAERTPEASSISSTSRRRPVNSCSILAATISNVPYS